jgi:hypothetical protein
MCVFFDATNMSMRSDYQVSGNYSRILLRRSRNRGRSITLSLRRIGAVQWTHLSILRAAARVAGHDISLRSRRLGIRSMYCMCSIKIILGILRVVQQKAENLDNFLPDVHMFPDYSTNMFAA